MIAQANSIPDARASEREIILSRTYDAPRELVWQAWTRAEHMAKWWGPNGFTTTTSQMEVRPGGVWRFVMHGPDGTDYQNLAEYIEVVEPELLVYNHGDGENRERDFHVTVTFTEEGGRTTVTSRMLFPTVEKRREVEGFGAVELGKQTFARLVEHLKTM
jgi:uncharacterized protein YndB with AHSA1/START domain